MFCFEEMGYVDCIWFPIPFLSESFYADNITKIRETIPRENK